MRSTSYHLGCAVSRIQCRTWHEHLADIQALGTRILRATTHLLDGLDSIHMTVRLRYAGSGGSRADKKRDLYTKSILPIGVLFSGSLILSNTAYLT